MRKTSAASIGSKMNRYLLPSFKADITYLPLNSVWERVVGVHDSYYAYPPFLIVRSMEDARYWTGPIERMSQDKVDNAKWLIEHETAMYYVKRNQRWGYTSQYGVIKKLRSKEEILELYTQIDIIDYEFSVNAPFWGDWNYNTAEGQARARMITEQGHE